jgi:hypothetical protein
MTYKIKHYGEDSELEFGQYSGFIISDVADKDPDYINWCVVNLEHFYLSSRYDLKEFPFSNEARIILATKAKLYEKQIADEHNLTCRDGYGEHDLDDEQCERCHGRVCIVCGCIDDCSYRDDKDYSPGSIYDEYGDEIEW